MTGTEKQIKWAEDLKADFVARKSGNKLWRITYFSDVVNALKPVCEGRTEPLFLNFDAAVDSLIDYVVANKTEAKWWIEARNNQDMADAVLTEWAASLVTNNSADAAAPAEETEEEETEETEETEEKGAEKMESNVWGYTVALNVGDNNEAGEQWWSNGGEQLWLKATGTDAYNCKQDYTLSLFDWVALLDAARQIPGWTDADNCQPLTIVKTIDEDDHVINQRYAANADGSPKGRAVTRWGDGHWYCAGTSHTLRASRDIKDAHGSWYRPVLIVSVIDGRTDERPDLPVKYYWDYRGAEGHGLQGLVEDRNDLTERAVIWGILNGIATDQAEVLEAANDNVTGLGFAGLFGYGNND